MANDNHLSSVTCYNVTMIKQDYIKLQDHEKRKTKAYTQDIGKHYNMTLRIFEDEQYYICHDGIRIFEGKAEQKNA